MEESEDKVEIQMRKRHRSRNFTKYEKEVFYSVFSQYASIINDKSSSVDSIRDAWNHLLQDYNSQHSVYPRTRRQLQVLWRDEKFRAKKRVKREQGSGVSCSGEGEGEGVADGERQAGSLLTPLLTVIKREHEAFTAGEAAAAAAAATAAAAAAAPVAHFHLHAPDSPTPSAAPPTTRRQRIRAAAAAAAAATVQTSPALELCINSNPEEWAASPLPVETQLESCSSSSPIGRLEQEEDSVRSPQEDIGYGSHRGRAAAPHWHQANGISTSHSPPALEREREYHELRLAQLREEGAARLRVLEAELALHQQQRQMLHQQHQLKMQILMEELKRVREEEPLKQ